MTLGNVSGRYPVELCLCPGASSFLGRFGTCWAHAGSVPTTGTNPLLAHTPPVGSLDSAPECPSLFGFWGTPWAVWCRGDSKRGTRVPAQAQSQLWDLRLVTSLLCTPSPPLWHRTCTSVLRIRHFYCYCCRSFNYLGAEALDPQVIK